MTMLLDGHNHLAWAMRQPYDADLDPVDLTPVVPVLHTDLTRLTAGGMPGVPDRASLASSTQVQARRG